MLIGEHAGLGGPTLYAVMAIFLFRIINWEDVQNGVAFDVVGLYAAACAMGVFLGWWLILSGSLMIQWRRWRDAEWVSSTNLHQPENP